MKYFKNFLRSTNALKNYNSYDVYGDLGFYNIVADIAADLLSFQRTYFKLFFFTLIFTKVEKGELK